MSQASELCCDFIKWGQSSVKIQWVKFYVEFLYWGGVLVILMSQQARGQDRAEGGFLPSVLQREIRDVLSHRQCWQRPLVSTFLKSIFQTGSLNKFWMGPSSSRMFEPKEGPSLTGLSRHRTSLIPDTIQSSRAQSSLLALPGTGTCVGTTVCGRGSSHLLF